MERREAVEVRIYKMTQRSTRIKNISWTNVAGRKQAIEPNVIQACVSTELILKVVSLG